MRSLFFCVFSLFFVGKIAAQFPYSEDFESGAGGWVSGGVNNDWALGSPMKPVINSAGSGTKCWVTGGLTGSQYANGERSWVESPTFNFTSLTRPIVYFKVFWESEQQFDGANFQYSTNGGTTWTNVGAANEPPTACMTENWFNFTPINFLSGLANPRDGWSGNIQPTMGNCLGGNGSGAWLTAKHCLTGLAGAPSVKFRFTFGAGTTCNNFDGFAFDDVHIENGPMPVASFTTQCNGNTFTFTDQSSPCTFTNWSWSFGDPASGANNISLLQNPSHTYNQPGVYTVTLIAVNACLGATAPLMQTVTVLGGTTSTTPASCNGGSNGTATISVLPNNLMPPPTIDWGTSPPQSGPTATNLMAGTYDVTVSSPNACPYVKTVVVSEPPALNHSVALTPASCNASNGSAIISETGGSPAYSYTWLPSGGPGAASNNLAAGAYNVTVTDSHGCTDLIDFVITSSTGVAASISSSTNVSCNGGSNGAATASGTGGTLPYHFLWSNSATTATISNLTAGNYTVTVTDNSGCSSVKMVMISQPSPLTHSISIQNATCGNSNGSATVVESGGTPNYSFTWSPTGGSAATASGLAAGNYVVSIQDSKGCPDTAHVQISNLAGPTISISNTVSVACFGGNNGSATASTMGGTAPFSFVWSPTGGSAATANNLAAGNFTVVVTDANGCTASTTATISQPTELKHSTTTVEAVCGNPNGSATVVESGGTPNYSFVWSPTGGSNASATNLSPGNYLVSVTDQNGCKDTIHVQIGNLGAPNVSIGNTIQILCFGNQTGSATASTTGGLAPFSYSWSNGQNGPTASNLAAGNFTVTATDANGCTGTATATITQPTALSHTTSAQQAACGTANGSATVVEAGGVGPYSFVWSPTGGSAAMASNLAAGVYIVSTTDQNGCLDTAVVTVSNPTGLTISVLNFTNVNCFSGNNGSANVAAANGQTPYVFSWNTPNGNGTTASNLTAGLYAVTVTDASQCSATAAISIAEPADFQHSILVNPASCGLPNGSATVVEMGGTTPFSFVWSPTGGSAAAASNLAPGNYVASITDQNGCLDTVHVQILNAAAPTISIQNTVEPLCFSGNDGSATAQTTGGTAPFSFAWSSGATGPTALNLAAGNFQVTVTDAHGCTASTTATIAQPADFSHSKMENAATCGLANGSASVVEMGGTAPYSFSWSPTGGSAAQAMNLLAGNYVVSITDSHNCPDTIHIKINGFSSPMLLISMKKDASCFSGNDGSATAQPMGGTAPFLFAWSPTGGSAATANGLAAGNFTAVVTDANGCTATATTTISQPTALKHAVSKMNATCNLPNGSASILETGGTPNYAFVWSPTGGSAASASGLAAGNYVVSATDQKGCLDTIHVQIQAIPAVVASISSKTDVKCFGQNNGSASAQATGGVGPFSYKWSSGALTPNANNLTAGSYVVTITDANGCTSTATATIAQPMTFSHSKMTTAAACGNANGSASILETGGTPNYLFVWSPMGGTNATASNLLAGNYVVSVTDANGCLDTIHLTILNIAGPMASISNLISPKCFGGNDGSATAQTTSGTAPFSFVWSNGATTATASNLTAGNFTVVVTDANGCSSSATATISQPAALAHAVTTQDVTCFANNGAASILETGGTAPYSFSWSPTGGSSNAANNLSVGNYVVSITDLHGCKDSVHLKISLAPTVAVSILSVEPKCASSSDGSLTAQAAGGVEPYTFGWSNQIQVATNPDLPNGQYFVTVQDATGCTAVADATLAASPLLTFLDSENVRCFGEKTGLISIDTTIGGLAPYQYSLDKTNFFTTTVFENLPSGFYEIKTLDANGCTALNSILLTEPPPFSVDAGLDTTIFLGETIRLEATASDPTRVVDFQWSPSLGLSCDSCATTAAKPLTTTLFSIQILDANGCAATDEKQVTVVLPPVYFPNVFSPNDDGDNDFFTGFAGAGIAEIESLKVFDRWGDLVFENRNFQPSQPLLGWSGRMRGKENLVAVYVFVAKIKFIDGSTKLFSGDVTLVK